MSDFADLTVSVLFIAIAAVLLLVAVYLVQSLNQSPKATESKSEALSVDNRSRPAGQLRIMSATALLEATGTAGLVEVIRNRLALSNANWHNDAWPVIERYLEFVQLLPASESHHHAQPGGLLTHTLEVTSYALTIRQGMKLPAGASTEDQVQRSAIWSFGVMLAALLHDIGKPVSDVRVQLFGEDANNPLSGWQALAGAMTHAPGASHYSVDFPPGNERDYQAHQRLSVILLHAIVPQATMRWLATDPSLLPALIGYLDDRNPPDAKAIDEIIKKADSISVADNLRDGPRVRFAKAKQAPLIERLMWGLRTLAHEGLLPLNRPGAAMFIDLDGQHVYAVAGVIADKVRAVLDERELRQPGASGIPTDNTRLFDTWAEYGALVPPDKAHGKGSVWWVRVTIDDWSQVLTVLKFRFEDIYTGAVSAPPPLPGQIEPVAPSTGKTTATPAAVAGNDELGDASVDVEAGPAFELTHPTTPTTDLDGDSAPHHSTNQAALEQTLPTDPDMLIEQLFSAYGDTQFTPGSTQTPQEFLNDQETATSAPPTLRVKKPVQALSGALTPTNSPPRAKNKAPGAKLRPNAESFVTWVQAGLGTGDLSYNESDSAVHFTAEGMALVSPRIFKLYLQEHAYVPEADQAQPKSPLNALQNDLQRGGYIRKNKKTNFYSYAIKQADGEAGTVRLTTYIIPNPQAYIRPVPAPNPLLILVAQPEADDVTETKHDA